MNTATTEQHRQLGIREQGCSEHQNLRRPGLLKNPFNSFLNLLLLVFGTFNNATVQFMRLPHLKMAK